MRIFCSVLKKSLNDKVQWGLFLLTAVFQSTTKINSQNEVMNLEFMQYPLDSCK